MDGVPLKIPMVPSQAVEEDVNITVPDYLSILQDTEVSIPTPMHIMPTSIKHFVFFLKVLLL